MKTLIRIFIFAILLFGSIPTYAVEIYYTDTYKYEYDYNSTATIIGHVHDSKGNCSLGTSITLPELFWWTNDDGIPIKSYTVASIEKKAFYGCSHLEKVTIPSSYIDISNTAFYANRNLKEFRAVSGKSGTPNGAINSRYLVNDGILYTGAYESSDWTLFCYPGGRLDTEYIIPEKCSAIGEYSFWLNYYLQEITIPDNVTEIGEYAFRECQKLTSVTISGNVKMIGSRAFQTCKELKSVVLKEGVETIGADAFKDCTSLETITIPASVTKIDAGAFSGCSSLKTVIILPGVKSFGEDVFSGCDNIQEVRIVDLSSWCQSSFANSEANPAYKSQNLNCFGETVKDLEIPSGTTNVGQNAFYGYLPLKSVIFENVSSMDESAFANCENLESVTFNHNVSSVAKDAFAGCNSITSLNIFDLTSWCNIDFSAETSNPLTYSKALFLNGEPISILEIPEDVSTIKKYTFNNGDFAQIWLPSSVTEIENYAFKDVHPQQVRCYNVNPPSVDYTSFSDYGATLYVPEEARTSYWIHSIWSRFAKLDKMPIDATNISIDKTNCELYIDETLTLNITFEPVETTDKTVVWKSSDPEIVSVDNDGTLKGLTVGQAIVTVTTSNGLTANCTVTVKPRLIESISLTPNVISEQEGAEIQIIANVLPENATDKSLEWTSSDNSIATVDQNGLVHLLKSGNATITATAKDGSGVSATCNVESILTGIEEILTENNEKWDLYNMQGVLLKQNISQEAIKQNFQGIYILRNGNKTIKIKL